MTLKKKVSMGRHYYSIVPFHSFTFSVQDMRLSRKFQKLIVDKMDICGSNKQIIENRANKLVLIWINRLLPQLGLPDRDLQGQAGRPTHLIHFTLKSRSVKLNYH